MNLRRVFDQVVTVEAAIAAVVFVVVVAVLAYGLIRYRGSRRSEASQDTEHPRVEALYAVGLFAIAIGIYIYTFHENGRETQRPGHPAVQVEVTGFQWCWRFHYVTPAPVDVTSDCASGHYPTLVVPTGAPVEFTTRSTDVIHAFWIPHFRYKIDVFPTKTNRFEMTIPAPGTWRGHCAEFCGEDHASMLFTLRAVPPAQFQQWLAAHPATTS